jgi:hypothetical protein
MAQIAVDFLWGTGWSSRLIGNFGFPQGPSHCASVIVDAKGRERYLDSRDNEIAGVPPGVHIREIATETWVKKQRASFQVSQADYDVWEKNGRDHITDEYDKDAILGFLEGKSIHTAGRYICSAQAVNMIQHMCRSWTPPRIGFIPFPLPVPAHEISPDALLLILATAGLTIGPVIVPGSPPNLPPAAGMPPAPP